MSTKEATIQRVARMFAEGAGEGPLWAQLPASTQAKYLAAARADWDAVSARLSF